MTAETDIAAIDDGGANTAAEVRTALTAVLGRGDHGVQRLDEVTLASNQASVSFSGISSGFRRLTVVGRGRSSEASVHADGLLVRVGSGTVDSGANYNFNVRGSHTEAVSGSSRFRIGQFVLPATSADAGVFGIVEFQIYDYADASQFRQVEWRGGGWFSSTANGANYQGFGGWHNAADAIDIITLLPDEGANLVAGSKFTLYGIS